MHNTNSLIRKLASVLVQVASTHTPSPFWCKIIHSFFCCCLGWNRAMRPAHHLSPTSLSRLTPGLMSENSHSEWLRFSKTIFHFWFRTHSISIHLPFIKSRTILWPIRELIFQMLIAIDVLPPCTNTHHPSTLNALPSTKHPKADCVCKWQFSLIARCIMGYRILSTPNVVCVTMCVLHPIVIQTIQPSIAQQRQQCICKMRWKSTSKWNSCGKICLERTDSILIYPKTDWQTPFYSPFFWMILLAVSCKCQWRNGAVWLAMRETTHRRIVHTHSVEQRRARAHTHTDINMAISRAAHRQNNSAHSQCLIIFHE